MSAKKKLTIGCHGSGGCKEPEPLADVRSAPNLSFKRLFSVLVAACIHEINNALFGIQLSSSIIPSDLDRAKEYSEEFEKARSVIYKLFDKLSRLRNLLNCGSSNRSDLKAGGFYEDEIDLLLPDSNSEDVYEYHDASTDGVKKLAGELVINLRCFLTYFRDFDLKAVFVAEPQDDTLHKTETNIQRINSIGPWLLTYLGRLVDSGLDFEDCCSIKTNLHEIFSPFIDSSDIVFHRAYVAKKSAKDIAVFCDPLFASLIITNILSNAKEAVHDKEPKISVDFSKFDGMVLVTFTDNGTGMTRDQVSQLMDPEQRFTTKDGENSTEHGIGFNYCMELANIMGGDLYVVYSSPENGTRIALKLPQVQQ